MVKGDLEPKRTIRPECITEEHIPGYYHSPLDRKLVYRRVIPTSLQSALIYTLPECITEEHRGITTPHWIES